MWREGLWDTAAFCSRQTKGAKQRYLATELEALALVDIVKHFSYNLYGKQFTVFTGHKPLCHLLSSKWTNPRLRHISINWQHWLLNIEYLPGKENGFADVRSRRSTQGWCRSSRQTPVWPQGMWGNTPHEAPARETTDGSTQAEHLN